MTITPTHYQLQNVATGRVFDDTGWLLDDPQGDTPSLIRAVYEHLQLSLKPDEYGLYRFADWLPIHRMLHGSDAPLTYKSEGFAKCLGLENLYITFNGYWPEKGIRMQTCSFKETEAYSVCARLVADEQKILVVASAGNTARAFAKVCSDNTVPLLLCVPEDCVNALWFEAPLNDCVKLISSASGSDYFDAIHLSNIVVKSNRFFAEGGAKNVARRDGMATTMLSATTFIGRIPDYYFQAVGSGTGAIAAWEANLRLIADGRFGSHKMKLMVSQNVPFLPMFDAWQNNSRDLPPLHEHEARKQVEQIDAKVLSNRKPPYGIAGGLFDALKDSGGHIVCATNEEARQAAEVFEKVEGIDIHPAAAIAVASLINEVKKGTVKKQDVVMLNITGGGEKRFKAGKPLHYLKPSIVFPFHPDEQEVLRQTEELF